MHRLHCSRTGCRLPGGVNDLRMVWGLIPALLLAACVTHDPAVSISNTASAGNWKIERQIDRVTGAPFSSALLFTANASTSALTSTRTASVQLTCLEGQPLVRIAFDFKIGSDNNAILGYRFDDKPGRDNVASRILIGYQVIVIEDRAAVADFVNDMRGAGTLYLRIRSLNAERTTAEFKLEGSEAAVQAGFAGCPLVQEPAKRKIS